MGKSWLVRAWGKRRFGRVVEVNLERRPEFRKCFKDPDPAATLERLGIELGSRIPADGSGLLFLDEIQSAPEVLSRLRWFAEETPHLPVVATGSLLDFAVRDPTVSMPVGRVTYLHLEPMGFEEFCVATGEEPLVSWLRDRTTVAAIAAGSSAPEPIHGRAADVFRAWLLVGGMPAAVEAWRKDRRHAVATAVHRDLLASLRDDFAKYSARVDHRRLTAVLDSVPHQLGGKFKYRTVDTLDRVEGIHRAVDLLCLARVCRRVVATPAQGVPLGAGVDERAFKLLHLDVGLATTGLDLALRDLEGPEDVTLESRGPLMEQAVGQLLRLTFPANVEPTSYWWRREKRGSEAEVDYVHAHGSQVVPIEVKAGKTGRLRSLHGFMADRGFPLAVRVNLSPPTIQDVDVDVPGAGRAKYRLLSIPAYLVEQLPRLLDELR